MQLNSCFIKCLRPNCALLPTCLLAMQLGAQPALPIPFGPVLDAHEQIRHFVHFFRTFRQALVDLVRFVLLFGRPRVALSAENLFIRKQLVVCG